MELSAPDIRRQAARLLDSAGIAREPVSLRDVVSALNLQLVRDGREPFTGEAAPEPAGDGRAVVPSGGERRRRLTIAREVGHFVLHPGRQAQAGRGQVGTADLVEEHEADMFAAELLMPEQLVRQAVLEHGADATRLADRFDVSRRTMRARLRQLGFQTDH